MWKTITRSLITSVFVLFAGLLFGCGGSSESGGDSPPPGSSNPGPSTPGEPSNNEPTSGFYGGEMAVAVTGGASDFKVRLRVVIDPGGGVAVFENSTLRAQARITGGRFQAVAAGKQESIFGSSCTADRRYSATIVGTNAKLSGAYTGVFNCSNGRTINARGKFILPRTGDHQ